MNSTYIIRYGEIALKGRNRILFERKLIENIENVLKQNNIEHSIKKLRGRIFVYAEKDPINYLKKIFGIVSVSHAVETDLEIEKIKETAEKLLEKKNFNSFRVTASRANKNFELKSPEIESQLGAFVVEKLNKKVSLKEFDLKLGVEIFDKAYLFTEKVYCFGGLPVGITGNVVCLIENENDLIAAWLMMKRGCNIFPVSFKEIELGLLKKYYLENELKIVKNIKEIAKIAEKNNCRALVLGQTMENFEDLGLEMLVLRPLIGYTKEQINELFEKIK
ncbi:hypothetical protein KY339_06205 [Candidatus Woesearchaeota archaeon]|nr:hypothetical protein [Candidatus Woesearchaeota archaeon]